MSQGEYEGTEPAIVIVKKQAQKVTRRAPAVALPLPDPLPDDQFPTKCKGETIAVPAPGESAGDTQSKGRREEEATVCRKREAEAAAEVVAAAEAEAPESSPQMSLAWEAVACDIPVEAEETSCDAGRFSSSGGNPRSKCP